ncbi:AraC family transcriptional regulator [Kribbella speibonae]|uniref:AraC family transcriptional regulator n=2 Tax=Kribbella speibonae TaxID=1572660 RepID=A0A4R0IT47_9ACTN|nr:AraC family transcriptional regulator [Kribbella speibonae]
MHVLARRLTVMAGGYQRITMSDQEPTPFGRVLLAGEVSDAEPLVPGPLHALPGTVISLVTAGTGFYRHADRRTEPIVGPSLTVVLPGEQHWYGTHPGQRWSEWFAVVEGPAFDLLRQTGRLTWSGPRPLPRGVREADLALLLRSAPPGSGAEQQIWALATWLSGALAPSVDDETALWDQAARLLSEDLPHRLEMRDVAAQLDLEYDRFRRAFRDRFGRSPLAFRNDRRLEAAATLLRATNLTCREIARRIGFSDEFHLSRRFRTHYGTSPTGYRSSRES